MPALPENLEFSVVFVSILFLIGSLTNSAQDKCDGDVEHAGTGEEGRCPVLAHQYQ